MRIGLIGAGNMASALARGLAAAGADDLLVFDVDRGRAEALAAETGARALNSNVEVARSADVVVLCHKPTQLGEVAEEVAGEAKAVVSILGGTPLAAVEEAYPDTPVFRFMPNIPAEVRRGVLCYAPGRLAAEGPEEDVLAAFGQVGTVVPLDEPLMDAATAVMSCGPAFFAFVIEALVDAGVTAGLQAPEATRMAVDTMAGTAEAIALGGYDPAALRRRVTSPGGMTERGLAALERGGVHAAFEDAVEAAAGSSR
jgi:pyrroline-5-carboxylate reductase